MEGKIKFSIIIPPYNRKTQLEKCLRVLSMQLKGNIEYEVIVIDDSGVELPQTDDSSLNLKYLSLNHRGPAAARNLGISRSQGDVILFLDDSLLLPGWSAATEKAWQVWPGADGIGGYIASEETDNIYSKVNADLFNWVSWESIHGGRPIFICTCNAGYKKSSLEMVGGFDESFKNAAGEDRDINIRLFNKNRVLRLDKNIAVFHDQGGKFNTFAARYFRYGKAVRFLRLKHSSQGRLSRNSYAKLYLLIAGKYKKKLDMCVALSLVIFSQLLIVLGYFTSLFTKIPQGKNK